MINKELFEQRIKAANLNDMVLLNDISMLLSVKFLMTDDAPMTTHSGQVESITPSESAGGGLLACGVRIS